MTLKKRMISSPNKPKRLTEEVSTKLKNLNLKVSLTSSEKPTPRTLSNTETINFKNSINLPTPSPS
jgi:hypothetical protein